MSFSFPLNIRETNYRARRAVIEKSRFGVAEHGGAMTIELTLSYPDGGAGLTSFGGYALDGRAVNGKRPSTAYGMDFAVKVMAAAGAENWESLQGSECLVLFRAAADCGASDDDDFWGQRPEGIATKDGANPFFPQAHAAFWIEPGTTAPKPLEELGGSQLVQLPAGSAVSFVSKADGTPGVAICDKDGLWSATGIGKGLDDFSLWSRTVRINYLGAAAGVA